MALNLPGTKQLLQVRTEGSSKRFTTQVREDFIRDNFRASALNSFWWTTSTVGGGKVTVRDGIVELFSGTTDLDYALLQCNFGGRFAPAPSSTTTVEVRFRKEIQNDGDADIFLGLLDPNEDPTNLVDYAAYREFNGDWDEVESENGDSGGTTTGTAQTIANGQWHTIKIELIATNNVKYYFDGSLIETLAADMDSNIKKPTIYIRCRNAAGTPATIQISWVKISITNPLT